MNEVNYTLISGQTEPPSLLDCLVKDGDNTNSSEEGPEYEFYINAQFVTGLILYPIICILGLLGNILSLIVLSQKKMQTSTNVFLSALAVGDTVKLINDLMYVIVLIILRVNPELGNMLHLYLYPYAHYIFNVAVCVTAWLTVSVAVERYIAVCHPTHAKLMCTVERARYVSVGVFVSMSILVIPCAMRYETVRTCLPHSRESKLEIQVTELWRNKTFMTAYTWVQNLLRSIIPLFVLMILNGMIIQALRKERVPGKKMTARNRITIMLIVVIVTFLVCIFPDCIMSTFFGFGYYDADYLVRGVRELTDTLLAINSAVNFIIYCSFSKVFRDTFTELFVQYRCHWKTRVHVNCLKKTSVANGKNPLSPNATNDQITVSDGPQTFV